MKSLFYDVICVGAGGTGGNFAKEFARYMAYFSKPGVSINCAIADGDKVEDSNISRQPFMPDDVAQNKAVVLVEAIKDTFNINNIFAYPEYIDEVKDLKTILNDLNRPHNYSNKFTILIGCVDNHRARQVMNDFFYNEENIVYIDAANEYDYGEICVGARINDNTIAPPRSFYFPEILKDNSPSASEMSCGIINEISPQHIITNLYAAHIILSFVVNIISEGRLECGIVHFNSFNYYTRFERYMSEITGINTQKKEDVHEKIARK